MRRTLPLLLLVVGSLGCGGTPSADTKPELPPAPAPTTAAKPPADPNAPSADRTHTYWQEVGKVQELAARKYAALADPKPDTVNALLTDAAKAIDELATEKVDADAVAVGKAFAAEVRARADGKPAPTAAGTARTARESLAKKYGREFAEFTSADKEPAFRLARDLTRPPLAQELARLKAESAAFDAKIKPVNDMLTQETVTKDKLQGEADSVRSLLKMQTEDVDLKKVREEVLADAVKELEAQKKVIDGLTKEVNALRAQKSELDRLAAEVSAVLAEGDPAKAEKLPLDRLDRLRVQADRVADKLAAQKK